jgi:hypothetical protein
MAYKGGQADYWDLFHRDMDRMLRDQLGVPQQELNQAMAAQQGNIYAQTGAQQEALARAAIAGGPQMRGAFNTASRNVGQQGANAAATANAQLQAQAIAQRDAEAKRIKDLAERQEERWLRKNAEIAANASQMMQSQNQMIGGMMGGLSGVSGM